MINKCWSHDKLYTLKYDFNIFLLFLTRTFFIFIAQFHCSCHFPLAFVSLPYNWFTIKCFFTSDILKEFLMRKQLYQISLKKIAHFSCDRKAVLSLS